MKGLDRTELLAGVERRLFLKQSLSLGALTMLTGCDLSNGEGVQRVLHYLDGWNERAQAGLFGRDRLARTFGEAEWAKDFRYNAFFPREKAPQIVAADYRLELAGLVGNKRPWTYDALTALQIGRAHV